MFPTKARTSAIWFIFPKCLLVYSVSFLISVAKGEELEVVTEFLLVLMKACVFYCKAVRKLEN